MPKKANPTMWYIEEFPDELLSAAQDFTRFGNKLEIYNAYRRKQSGFKTRVYDSNKEKMYRLYHYQGLDMPDRMLIHNEVLDINRWYFLSVNSGIGALFVSFAAMYSSVKYVTRPHIRLFFGAVVGEFVFISMNAYARRTAEANVTHLYEKYRIK